MKVDKPQTQAKLAQAVELATFLDYCTPPEGQVVKDIQTHQDRLKRDDPCNTVTPLALFGLEKLERRVIDLTNAQDGQMIPPWLETFCLKPRDAQLFGEAILELIHFYKKHKDRVV